MESTHIAWDARPGCYYLEVNFMWRCGSSRFDSRLCSYDHSFYCHARHLTRRSDNDNGHFSTSTTRRVTTYSTVVTLRMQVKSVYPYSYFIYKASPKRYRTFEIARQWASAGRSRRWCCVAGTLSFILTLATSRHFQLVMSYAALSERVFSALGDFL